MSNRPDPTPEQLEAARAAGLPDGVAWRLEGDTPAELDRDASEFAALFLRPLPDVPSDDERRAEAARNTLGLALAVHRGDQAAAYRLWQTLTEVERIDLLAGLAQLPGLIARACGLDPERILGQMLDAYRLS